jgi:hypothetical protein
VGGRVLTWLIRALVRVWLVSVVCFPFVFEFVFDIIHLLISSCRDFIMNLIPSDLRRWSGRWL